MTRREKQIEKVSMRSMNRPKAETDIEGQREVEVQQREGRRGGGGNGRTNLQVLRFKCVSGRSMCPRQGVIRIQVRGSGVKRG